MKRLFAMDGAIFVFLSKLADMMILNVLFLVSCIPCVTIGAALSALYETSRRCICHSEGYIVRTYWKSFKENFKRSTIFFFLSLFGYVFLYFDIRCIASMTTGDLAGVLELLVIAIALFFTMIVFCYYPYKPFIALPIREEIKKTFLFAVIQLPTTIMMMVLNLGPVIYVLVTGKIYLPMIGFYLLIGFALTKTVESFFLNMTFRKLNLE